MPLRTPTSKERANKKPATYASVKSPETKQEIYAAELRKEIAIAGLRELELQEKNGSMVLVEDVAEAWADQCATIKNGLMAIPDRIAPRLNKMKSIREVRNLLMDEISKVLENLAEEAAEKAA